MNEERLTFGLISNAVDYLDSAADHALEDSSRAWKYALINVAAGVELLFKACLTQKHWSLVFANIDKADEKAFKAGDFVSVNFDETIDRMKNIAHITLPEADLKKLDHLRRYRNRVQHFAIDVAQEQVVSLIWNAPTAFRMRSF